MAANEVPKNWVPPSPTINVVGKVIKVVDKTTLRVTTTVWDRMKGERQSAEMIAMRDTENKHKNKPIPPEGSTINFSAKIYSQDETSKLFVIHIEDYTWVSAATTAPVLPTAPTSPTDPTTPQKRPPLGKRKWTPTESEAGPSRSTS
ncbi:hypothetical protein CF319_g2876 [Tilletia indica]|nr:hypothetical protein CF319_g2876 [Tilletia indica]